MKSADWKNVKVGTSLILADVHTGVYKVRVHEIDVEIAVDFPTYHKARPYGLTRDRGVVKISLDGVVQLASLSDLIKSTQSKYIELLAAYNRYLTYKASMETTQTEFQTLVNTERQK